MTKLTLKQCKKKISNFDKKIAERKMLNFFLNTFKEHIWKQDVDKKLGKFNKNVLNKNKIHTKKKLFNLIEDNDNNVLKSSGFDDELMEFINSELFKDYLKFYKIWGSIADSLYHIEPSQRIALEKQKCNDIMCDTRDERYRPLYNAKDVKEFSKNDFISDSHKKHIRICKSKKYFCIPSTLPSSYAKKKYTDNEVIHRKSPPNGACLFNSVINFLYYENKGKIMKVEKLNKKAKKLRKKVVKWLWENEEIPFYPEKFGPMTTKEFVENDRNEDFEDYLNDMKKTSTWGGQIEILVMSKLYQRTIVVYTKSSGGYKRIDTTSFIFMDDPPITLLYNADEHDLDSGDHYDYLTENKGGKKSKIGKKRKKSKK